MQTPVHYDALTVVEGGREVAADNLEPGNDSLVAGK